MSPLAHALLMCSVWIVMTSVSSQTKDKSLCLERGCVLAAADVINFVDPAVDPCEDFYGFVCRRWMDRIREPFSDERISVLRQMEVKAHVELMRMIEHAPPNDSKVVGLYNEIVTFFNACIRSRTRNSEDLQPLVNIFQRLGIFDILVKGGLVSNSNSYTSARKQLEDDLLKLAEVVQIQPLFTVGVDVDDRNKSKVVVSIDPAHTCDSWDPEDTKFSKAVDKLSEQLEGTDLTRPFFNGDSVVNWCETSDEIGVGTEFVTSNIKMADIKAACDIVDFSEIINRRFASVVGNGYEVPSDMTVSLFVESGFFTNLCNLTKLILQDEYVRQSFYNSLFLDAFMAMANYVPQKYNHFTKTPLKDESYSGYVHQCLDIMKDVLVLGKAVASLYIHSIDYQTRNKKLTSMVHHIQEAAKEMLCQTDWMSMEAREKSVNKVNKMKVEALFHPSLLNVSEIEKSFKFVFDTNNFIELGWKALTADTKQHLALITSTSDVISKQISGLPFVLNAFYSSPRNTIRLLMAMVDDYYFNVEYPDYMNYGGYGTVLGHEVGHAFDDNGRQFDYDGALMDWWDNETVLEYAKRADCYRQQYSHYSKYNISVNGTSTLDENIADDLGLKLGFIAYKKFARNTQRLPALDSYTDEQLFFIAHGKSRCVVNSAREMLNTVEGNTHAPEEFRLVGTIQNSVEFATAFKCKSGSKMNPPEDKKCKLF